MPYPLEQACFVEFLAVRKPKYICEIGMSLGVSLWLMSRAATDDAVVIGVEHTKDLPAKDFAAYGRAQQTLITVRGDAHTPETVAEVKHFLGGHLLDVLYLDADHTVEDLAIEMGCYVGLVREGGIVAFHDAQDVGSPPQEAWNALRAGRPSTCFWGDGYGYGIAAVEMVAPGKVTPEPIRVKG